MEWNEIRLYTTTEAVEIVSGYLISHGLRGLMIEDAQDFRDFLEDTTVHWDYIDEDLMKLRDCETAVTFYLPENMQGIEQYRAIQGGLAALRAGTPSVDFGRLALERRQVQEEDWSTAWKKYYHPVRVGRHLIACPCWEECEAGPQDVPVLLDPGMAFGTGTHETTRLCMELLEDAVTPGASVLDVGTGSGILAITALLLGARSAVGVDIDELAVKIAGENAALNGVAGRLTLLCGDLTEQVSGTFDIVCANIVADVLIRLSRTVTQFLRPDSVLLVSGIIEDRYGDVANALAAAGLTVTGKRQENDWIALRLSPAARE